MEKVHAEESPSWVTVTVTPATVSVPVRGDVLELAATEYATVPLPVPVLPEVIVIQAAFELAVHGQPEDVMTATLLAELPATTVTSVGEAEKVQGPPAWFTVIVTPATVRVPVRGDVLVLAATVYVTVPLPLPAAPELIVSHGAFDVADQLHPEVVVTTTLLVELAAPTSNVVGEAEKVQLKAAWVTVIVTPATVKVPVRGEVVVLAATE
jgi:hypothetical protein